MDYQVIEIISPSYTDVNNKTPFLVYFLKHTLKKPRDTVDFMNKFISEIVIKFNGEVKVVGYVEKKVDFTICEDICTETELLDRVQNSSLKALSDLGLYKPFITNNPLFIIKPIAIYT